MKQFKQFKRAYDYQYANVCRYDNAFNALYVTGIFNIDELQFVIKETKVLWLIMADNYDLNNSCDESAIEYGVTKNGKWAAVYDAHCSCQGWEADRNDVTYYSNLDELLKCDENANVILKYKDALVNLYPFLLKHFPK